MICWRDSLDDIPREGAVVVVRLLDNEPNLAPMQRDICEAPVNAALRESFLLRRALTRRLVAARLNIDAHDVIVGHALSGAPMIVAPVCNLNISVSGRENFCSIGLADAPIGVDIEPLGAPFEAGWNVLHEDERRALLALDESARREMFLRLWTAKEAYLKALGVGLAIEPQKIAIAHGDEDSFVVQDVSPSSRAERSDDAAQWRKFDFGGRIFIAACILLADDRR